MEEMEKHMMGVGEEMMNEETNRYRLGGRERVFDREPEGERERESERE